MIWHASMETEHYSFHAFGKTEEEARHALNTVWCQHARKWGLSTRPEGRSIDDWWGVRAEPSELGGGYVV